MALLFATNPQDSYPFSALTVAERNAIPAFQRKFGQLVTVWADPTASNNRTWVLADAANGGVDSDPTNNSNWILYGTSTFLSASGGGGGSVTSVGLSMPGIFAVANSPVTTSGTLAVSLANQTANTIFAGPSTGAAAAPTFRAMVTDDLPNAGTPVTGLFAKITTDSKGRVTATAAVSGSDIDAALGYTPYSAANPNGYISVAVTSLTAGAGISLNNSTGAVTITNTITNNNQLTNGSGYITASSTNTLTNKSGNISQWTNDSGYLTAGSVVTSLIAGTGISVNASVGAVTVTNTAPDLTVTLTNGGNISISGTYPNFTLTNGITNNNQLTNGAGYITASSTNTLTNKSGNISQWTNDSGYLTAAGAVTSLTAGTGISLNASTGAVTVTNSAPDQTVTLTNGGNISISGTYPNFTLTNGITNNNQLTNGAGYITASTTDTLINKSGNISMWANNVGYITASSTDTLTNKSGNISQWTNDSGYITSASLTGYVPYTGATTNVNLGSNTITAGGATLTGVLSGTSSTFSGFGLFGGATTLTGIGGGIATNNATTSGVQMRVADVSKGFVYATSSTVLLEAASGSTIQLAPNGSTALTLATTGAATFANSVTGTIITGSSYVVGGYLQASGATGLLVLTSASWGASSEVRNNTDINGSSGGDYFALKNPSGKSFSWVVNSVSISNLSSAGLLTTLGYTNPTGNNTLNTSSGVTSIGPGAISTYQFNVKGAGFSENSNSVLNSNKFGWYGSFNLTTTGSESDQYINAAVAGAWSYSAASGTYTPNAVAKNGAVVGSVFLLGGATYSGIANGIFADISFSESINVTTAATLRAAQPKQIVGQTAYSGTVTNMCGLYIDDINASSLSARFTNKYGIYQVGINDKNYFGGEIISGSGQSVTSSTDNTTTHKVKWTINGVDYYLFASTSNT